MVKPISLNNQLIEEKPESRILSAARQEFITHGFKGARMQAIADSCGCNKALLHYYFRTKERLYQEVFRDIMHTMKGALESHLGTIVVPDGDIRSLLHGFITVYINTLRDNPDFPRFILRELVEGGNNMPKVIELLAPSLQEIPVRVRTIIAREMKAGTIKQIDPLHLMLNVLGMCIFTFIAQPVITGISTHMNLGITFDESFFRTRIDTILDMTLHGITLPQHKR